MLGSAKQTSDGMIRFVKSIWQHGISFVMEGKTKQLILVVKVSFKDLIDNRHTLPTFDDELLMPCMNLFTLLGIRPETQSIVYGN